MNRVTFLFLGFLVLATLSAGTAYQNGLTLLRAHGDVFTGLFFLVGMAGVGFTLLVLGHIVYLTTPRARQSQGEE